MRHRTMSSELERSRSQVVLLALLSIMLLQLALPAPEHSFGRVVMLAFMLYFFCAGLIATLMYFIYLNEYGQRPGPGGSVPRPSKQPRISEAVLF